MNEYFVIIVIFFLITGCSSGKHKDLHNYNKESGVLTENLSVPKSEVAASNIQTKKLKFAVKNQRTLFIHPGLMLGIDWGGDRAHDAGAKLIKDGYYNDLLEVRSRRYLPMYEQMIKEKNTSYLGIHYSMGGSPAVVNEAIKASEKASSKLDQTLVYNAILVDPFGFSDVSNYIDPDSPNLGTVFIIASSNYSLLRPNMNLVSSKISNHEKFHYIYPEDFGLSWDHFGFLSAIRDDSKNNLNTLKVKGIFYFLVNAIYQNVESNTIEFELQKLRDKYRQIETIADARLMLGEDNSNPEITMIKSPLL
jgi:hypothetical protein